MLTLIELPVISSVGSKDFKVTAEGIQKTDVKLGISTLNNPFNQFLAKSVPPSLLSLSHVYHKLL